MKFSGVYAIVNNGSGKRYVGSSYDLYGRLRWHRTKLLRRTHNNRYLQRAWIKHGAESFTFIILELCPPKFNIEAEQKYIDEAADYNLSPTAQSPLGTKHSKESCARMSAAAKIRMQNVSPETRGKLSAATKQKMKDPAYKDRLRQSNSTKAARAKCAAAHRTPKYRALRSSIIQRLWASPEFREKIRLRKLATRKERERSHTAV